MGKSVYNVSRLPLKIPWSKANFHYGYIYGIEGLSFADVSSGPSRWINKAYYKCWFNIEENDSKPVSQSHKTWSIVNTDAVHEYNLHHQLYTLEITEGSHFIFNSDLRITQSLKITDGSLTICGEPLYVKDIEIGKNGRLVIQGDSTILVSGDWTNNNNFFPRSESVVFNGKVPQKISTCAGGVTLPV